MEKYDINTLLLKSQYNHINHLDSKLNEVTSSVVALEHKFEALEQKFINLEQKFDSTVKELRGDYEKLEHKIEHTIQKALNKNMLLLIVVMGAFLTLSKVIDKF